MKTGYKRFDIWNARLAIGEHPIVIISNWKSNMKSKDVNVCIITSQVKSHPSHVIIEGFGLNKVSQVKCDNIYTVSKSNLKFKIGEIDDIAKQIEIDDRLKSQLQLEQKYNNSSIEDLETLFLKSNTDKVIDIRKLSDEITYYLKNNNIDETIRICNKLILNTKDNSYLWHGYYHLGLCLYKQEKYHEALFTTKNTFKYLNLKIDDRYALTMFLLASCYSKVNNTDKAIQIYYKLASYYKSINYTNLRAAVIFNIANIFNNKKAKVNLIRIVESTNRLNTNYTYMTKESLLKQMYEEL